MNKNKTILVVLKNIWKTHLLVLKFRKFFTVQTETLLQVPGKWVQTHPSPGRYKAGICCCQWTLKQWVKSTNTVLLQRTSSDWPGHSTASQLGLFCSQWPPERGKVTKMLHLIKVSEFRISFFYVRTEAILEITHEKICKVVHARLIRSYMVTEHLPHIGLFHDLSSPVALQHGVLQYNRYSSQDEGQEEIGMNVVPSAAQFPGQKKVPK